jgi:mRNA interferase MazF
MMAKNLYRKWMIVLVNLDPTIGVEIKKIRPCLIVSPDAVNQNLLTVLVAPLTTTIRNIPSRLKIDFNQVRSEVCFDQMKAIDISRIIKILGTIDNSYRKQITLLLHTMFSDEV